MSPAFTLLLVDDNEEILDFLKDDLEEKYAVLTATNGQEALEQLNAHIVHLIISDIMMPGMDGLEFCNYVKSHFAPAYLAANSGEARAAVRRTS